MKTKHRSVTCLAVLLGAVACADAPTVPPARAAAAVGKSDIPLALSSPGWQEAARNLIVAKGANVIVAGRLLAVLGLAQYLAVTEADRHYGIDADVSLTSDGLDSGGRALLEARRGAVAGSSDSVLAYFYRELGMSAAARQALADRVASEAEAGPGGVSPQFAKGLEIGRAAATRLVERARTDHFNDPWQGTVAAGYPPTGGEGQWYGPFQPVGSVLLLATPYLLTSRDQFRTSVPVPPSFMSVEFLQGLDELRTIAINRTSAQRDTAVFWQLGLPTTLAGWWNAAAAGYVAEAGMDERQATRVFALTHTAIADAYIACWDVKFTYLALRPNQADALVYGDGVIANNLPFPTPPMPSYPSGHTCSAAAAGAVLNHFFPAHQAYVDETVGAIGRSRMYGLIHYRFDIEGAMTLGQLVADRAIHLDRSGELFAALLGLP